MKINKLMIVASLFISMVVLEATAQTSDWANIKRYNEANKEVLQNQSSKENRVVFMGNSITEGWVKQHPDFFKDNNFVGRGISGQTTYQFLVRFRNDVIDLEPAVVVINGGINDIAENNYAYNEDLTFGNLVSMAELANANGIEVVMTSLVPSNRCGWRPQITDVAEKVASLNKRIEQYARENGYAYVDYFTPMVVAETGALDPAYSNDGVHPTSNGYLVMENVVLPVIQETLKKRNKK